MEAPPPVSNAADSPLLLDLLKHALSGPTSRPTGPAVATHGQPTQRGEGPVGEPGRQAAGGPEVQVVRGGVAGQLQVTVLVVEA